MGLDPHPINMVHGVQRLTNFFPVVGSTLVSQSNYSRSSADSRTSTNVFFLIHLGSEHEFQQHGHIYIYGH